MKKLLIGSLFLIFLLVLYFIIYHYPNNQEEVLSYEDQEKLRENLAKFYAEYVDEPFTENITCNGDIIIYNSKITEKFSCVSFPLYSSIGEAWYVVARGNYSWESGYVNTIVGDGVSENDRIKKIYSDIISEGNSECDVPCYDSFSPKMYDIDVSFSPEEQKLRKMFLEMDYDEINSLILHSDYSVQLDYDVQNKPEHSFSFGFRMGWIIPSKFSLNVKVADGEILDYSIKKGEYENRNKDCETCRITRLDSSQIQIEGTRGWEEYPILNMRWKPV
jgi:hypothetical protein